MKSQKSLDRDGWQAIKVHIEGLKQKVKDQGSGGFILGLILAGQASARSSCVC